MFIQSLVRRRVPQIVGLYIAATWMMIEIGDWMVERFALLPELTSYIFIGMLVFLPSVCYLAYVYGQPGKDPWKKPTFAIVPGNLVLAILAMVYFVSPVVATETRVITNEKGERQFFEVAKSSYRNKMVQFFWSNESGDKQLDWLQYGLPWLLSQDLDRSLFIASDTLLEQDSIYSQIEKRGFEIGQRVPNALRLKLARGQFYDYLVTGRFSFDGKNYRLTAEVTEVSQGTIIAAHTVSGEDYLGLIDELTLSIKKSLNVPKTLDDQTADLPVKEHISESKKAIEYRIEAGLALLNNDYALAKEQLEDAIVEDFSFANAYGQLAMVNQYMGNSKEASEALAKGLQHEYKFTRQKQFHYKAMAYGLRGDYESQQKVYDMWLALEPDNIEALQSAANLLIATGLNHDKALKSLSRLRELNPNDKNVLKSMAQLFVLTSELDKATDVLNRYLESVPQDKDALDRLANVYVRSVEFEKAKAIYGRVLLLDLENITAALKLIDLNIRLGEFTAAEEGLNRLLMSSKTESEKFSIYSQALRLYDAKGQINQVIETFDLLADNASQVPPILQIFRIHYPKAIYAGTLKRSEEALAEMARLRSQLQPPLDGIIDSGVVNIHILNGELDMASEKLEALDDYIKSNPNPMFTIAVNSNKAQLHFEKGDYEKARDFYQKTVLATQGNAVNSFDDKSVLLMRALLARTLTKLGSFDEAEDHLKDVIEHYPALAIAHVALAENYLEQGLMDEYQTALGQAETIWADTDDDYYYYQMLVNLKEKAAKMAAES